MSVPYLREGFKYNFEIYKYRAMPPDVEDSECTVAECEVSVECKLLSFVFICDVRPGISSLKGQCHFHFAMKSMGKF